MYIYIRAFTAIFYHNVLNSHTVILQSQSLQRFWSCRVYPAKQSRSSYLYSLQPRSFVSSAPTCRRMFPHRPHGEFHRWPKPLHLISQALIKVLCAFEFQGMQPPASGLMTILRINPRISIVMDCWNVFLSKSCIDTCNTHWLAWRWWSL